ncbi:Plexin domain-containing protein 2 [Formica fusca]
MAREEERWCFFNGPNGRQRPMRIPLLLVVLCALLVGSLTVVAEHDDSYYNYAGCKSKRSLSPFHYDTWKLILIGDKNVPGGRIRRTTSEMVVTNEQKDEPPKDQPSPQPQQQPQQPPQLATNTTNTRPTYDQHIKYISGYSTSEATVQFRTTEATSTPVIQVQSVKDAEGIKIPSTNFTNPKKKVTQSVKADDTATLNDWTNRTLSMRNITVSKELPSVDSSNKSNNQTKETELAKDANAATSGTEDAEKSDDIGDISISKFSDVTNTTLTQNNITKTVYDTHQYYNSTFIVDAEICKKYWVDMDNHPDLRVNHLLSQSHRRAATVKLKFDFPFYGYNVRNITIATGGFLYTGDYVHSWLAATQYIAPLMANFDTRLSNESCVKYADNGTAFTVEWEKVILQDHPKAGPFTFQVTLHQNGDIVFVYSVIPLVIEDIEDTLHPVKVGLSDAYIMDRTVFFVRRKTIYEYHRVNFNRQDIKSCTVIYLKALPTCLNFDNCWDCLTKVPEFDCKWCPELKKCSTGTSRQRQEWLLKGCDVRNIKEANICPAQITTYRGDEYDHDGHVHPEKSITANEMSAKQERPGTSPLESTTPNNMNMGVSGVIGILTIVALVAGLAAWGAYAYRNPHSASGQMLIRYRPSQWSWRRGEARYTAATIHM